MTHSRRKLLIEEHEPLGSDTPRPSKWWRYGAIAAGAGLAAARLGGVAFAAPHDAVHDTTPSWSYDPGHDAATWTLASQEYAPGHGDGNKDDKKGGDPPKHEKNAAKQAAKPQEPAKPQAAHQDEDQGKQAHDKAAAKADAKSPAKQETPKSPAVPTAVLGEQATPDDQSKVGICHQTGSSSNPRVFIEVSKNAVKAHKGHGDRVGVSAEDCANGQVSMGTPTALPTTTAPAATSTPVPTDTAVGTPTVVPTGTVLATGTVEATTTPTVNPNETVVVTETPLPIGTVPESATAQATNTALATVTVAATDTPQATVTGTPPSEVLGEQASRGFLEVLVANLSKLLGGLFGGR